MESQVVFIVCSSDFFIRSSETERQEITKEVLQTGKQTANQTDRQVDEQIEKEFKDRLIVAYRKDTDRQITKYAHIQIETDDRKGRKQKWL